MKKILIILPVLFSLLFCGFGFAHKKPYAVLSSTRITDEFSDYKEIVFAQKQRIYFAVFAPEGFKYSGIRIQLSKQDEKTANWGFSIVNTEDIYVTKGNNEFRNYVVAPTSGHYILQCFYLNNTRYPFIHREFWVR